MARVGRDAALKRGLQLLQAGLPDEAAEVCRTLSPADRKDPEILYLLGLIALERQQATDASSCFQRALKSRPTDAKLHVRMAETRLMQGRVDEGLESYCQALRHQPGFLPAVHGQAGVLEKRGDLEAALATATTHLKGGAGDPQILAIAVTVLSRLGRHDEAVAMAETHIDDNRFDPFHRRQLHFALGRAHDRVGEYDEAFRCFSAGNALLPRGYDRDRIRGLHEAIIEAFSAEALASLPRSSLETDVPVYIVGMPRSGSTLVERIIDAHPRAHGGGELPIMPQLITRMPSEIGCDLKYPACVGEVSGAQINAFATSVLRALRKQARHAARITDKMLTNYANLGLISLLFPNARVIHCRRDPLDLGLSCYMNLSPRVQRWATDLADIGFAHLLYERTMAHWRNVLASPILEVEYETLVANPEAGSRAIIEFCGLEWDDRCLQFHESKREIMTHSYDQANRPMYESSVGRHTNYDRFLDPLREALSTPLE